MMEFLKSITSKEALKIIESFPIVAKTETVDIENALCRILAEDIISMEDIPPFSRSLVDGFALITKDTYGAKETNPSFLYTKGEIKVGEETKITIEDGHTVYISTGAMIPEGADGVIMEEYVRRTTDGIELTKAVHKGENICFVGEDIKKGGKVLNKGKRLSPFDLGMLSSLGHSKIPVYKKAEVGIISSGDEIVEIHHTPPPGKVRDINRYTITNLLKKEGSIAKFIGITKDNIEDITEILASAHGFDMLLISGGSSKGERDFVTASIERLGGKILFHGINIKPGKPTIFGTLWNKPIFGLPGHPASCVMVVIRYVLPLLRRLQGEETHGEKKIKGILTTNIPSSFGIEEYIRITTKYIKGKYYIYPIFAKSSVISSLTNASGYIVIPEGKEGYEKDEEVEVYLLE